MTAEGPPLAARSGQGLKGRSGSDATHPTCQNMWVNMRHPNTLSSLPRKLNRTPPWFGESSLQMNATPNNGRRADDPLGSPQRAASSSPFYPRDQSGVCGLTMKAWEVVPNNLRRIYTPRRAFSGLPHTGWCHEPPAGPSVPRDRRAALGCSLLLSPDLQLGAAPLNGLGVGQRPRES